METEILSILKHFGWNESFHIPVANEKNKLLECRIEETLKKKAETTTLLADLTDEWNALKNYYNDIVEQRSHNEKILYDYKKQLEAEKKINDEILYENNRLLNESREIAEKKKALIEDNANKQAQLGKLQLKSQNIRDNIKWCKEIEQYWNEWANKENRNVNILENFNTEDDAEFKKVELKRQQLVSEVQEYENILNNKQDAIISVQNNVEKTTKMIDGLGKERSWLLDQWKSTTRVLRLRSDGVDEIIREIDILKKVSRSTESKMLDYKNFYKEQIRNNMEIEMEIRSLLRTTYRQQLINEKKSEELAKKTDEKTLMRRVLTSLGDEIDGNRINNTITKRKINRLKDQIEELMSSKNALKNKYESVKDRSISLSDRIKQLENILSNQRKGYNTFLQEQEKLITSIRMNEYKIYQTKEQSKIVKHELKHQNNLFSKLFNLLQQRKKEKEKENETLANIRQQINKVNVEMDLWKGGKYLELKLETEKQIILLTNNLESKRKIIDSIQRDLNLCNGDVKKLNREMNLITEKRNELIDEKQNLKLIIEGGEKTLGKEEENNKGKEVIENKLRLKANHLEHILSKSSEYVESLEKQRITVETSLQERLLEIQSSTNLLKIRKKLLQEEVSNLNRNIDCVNHHINQLLNKYEIVTQSLEKDDMGQPLTISNYKVELVKTRYSLLEKGDDLDEKIRKAEKEIKAMENTLLLVDVANSSLKKINTAVNTNGPELEEKERLGNEYEELYIQAKQQKKLIPEIKKVIESLKNSLAEKNDTQQQLLKLKKEKELLISQLERDLQNQKVKLERVKNRLQNQKARLKSFKHLETLERGFHLRELQSINKTALGQLTELISHNNSLSTPINTYLTEKGISLPVTAPTKKIHS